MKNIYYSLIILCITFLQLCEGLAQDNSYRPGLLFREDWKEIPAYVPVTQQHVINPYLVINSYGPGKDSLKKSHHEMPVDDPYYVWSGLCTGTWLVTLKHRNYLLDLSEYAKVKWRSKQSGFRELHIVLKLGDGTWLISDLSDGLSADWRIKEFNIMDIKWYGLNVETIAESKIVVDPDLSRVDEIGFTDLMPGGGSDACSRLDWIEVYGKVLKR